MARATDHGAGNRASLTKPAPETNAQITSTVITEARPNVCRERGVSCA
jgi:hypothetical protein